MGSFRYKAGKELDRAIYERAFRRATATGDFSALREWKKGHFRRKQGIMTKADYQAAGR